MLTSATEHRTYLDDAAAVAVAGARRAWTRRDVGLIARQLSVAQMKIASASSLAVADMLDEQGIDAPPVATLAPEAFRIASDGRTLAGLFAQAATLTALEVMVVTQVADIGRTATSVASAARPQLKGYIRNVGATCCSRCAILSGKFYRYSDGFLRHPRCRCTHVPTDDDALIEAPEDLFRQGRITDLSAVDRKAIEDGADLGQVVNVRRKAAGLTEMGRALERGGRLTPAGIYRLASTREEAIRLLERSGYVRGVPASIPTSRRLFPAPTARNGDQVAAQPPKVPSVPAPRSGGEFFDDSEARNQSWLTQVSKSFTAGSKFDDLHRARSEYLSFIADANGDRWFTRMNRWLRKGTVEPAEVTTAVANFYRLFKARGIEADKSLVVYRGSRNWDANAGAVLDEGFMSASVSSARAGNFGEVAAIEVPVGSVFIPGNLSEWELVFPPGSVLEVIEPATASRPPRFRLVIRGRDDLESL